MYSPLAVASLTDVIASHQSDHHAKLALLKDYVSGLSYLHDQKGMMHRDINPNNLAVVSFTNPKGVILDLDSVTKAGDSTDHMRGTFPYLAPEILRLKNWDGKGAEPAPYTKSVDIWALGLSMSALYSGQPWRWEYFLPSGQTSKSSALPVTAPLYQKFQKRTQREIDSCADPYVERFLQWILDMTKYGTSNRISASNLLVQLEHATRDLGRGTLVLKGTSKRCLEE